MRKYVYAALVLSLLAAGCQKQTQTKDPPQTLENAEATSARGFPSGTKEYPWHTNITATVFWVGEPVGNGSSEDNAVSAYDDNWRAHFGCFDDPEHRSNFFPADCTPKENPFYLDVPYNDFADSGIRKPDALSVAPWAKERSWKNTESLMKNQWVELYNPETKQTCYGQIEDTGPYEYDDVQYVFSAKDERPKSQEANNAGLDVSPALRDCLKFSGTNNDENIVNWRFIEAGSVPSGPWKQIVTTSQVDWE